MPRHSARSSALADLNKVCLQQAEGLIHQADVLTTAALLDSGNSECVGLAIQGASDCQQSAIETIRALGAAHSHRYLLPRAPVWRPTETLWDRLKGLLAAGNLDYFRSAVRMEPGAFDALVSLLKVRPEFQGTRGGAAPIQQQVAVALYRLGNALPTPQVATLAGCSMGSVHGYTIKVVRALSELETELIPWASEEEKREAKDWVSARSGVPEFGQGFAMVDGTHVPLAWRPGKGADDDFINRKGGFSFNIQLFTLPTSLRIISYVVGPRGRSADSSVFALSAVSQTPALFLERDEFIWADLGYPLNDFSVIPYRHTASQQSRDFRRFNYWHSHTRIRVEHAVGFLKGRFSCLRGLRGYVSSEDGAGEIRAQDVIVACIAAHNLAMSWDDAGQYRLYVEDGLGRELGEDIWWNPSPQREEEQRAAWTRRADAQRQRAAAHELASRDRSQRDNDQRRRSGGRERRELLHVALNRSMNYSFLDTSKESRMEEKTKKQLVEDRKKKLRRAEHQQNIQ